MRHPWDKGNKNTKENYKENYKEFDMYLMVTGFKADKKTKKYTYNRDRYGAKARKKDKVITPLK